MIKVGPLSCPCLHHQALCLGGEGECGETVTLVLACLGGLVSP